MTGDNVIYTIESMNNGIKVLDGTTFASRRLYITTGNNITTYSHTGTGIPSQFYRYITIKPAEVLGDTTTIDANMKKITSTVEYPQL